MTKMETNYIAVRKKEGLFYTDEQVKRLPEVAAQDPHLQKWQMRKKSTGRLLQYLQSTNKNNPTILDLGCGNGWFSARLAANITSAKVVGWDVNQVELDQAKTIFSAPNLRFDYQDIFDKSIDQKFDFIIINGVIQYFPTPATLMQRSMELLNEVGEIHILDSPFYKEKELAGARERSKVYYEKAGIPEMTAFYFHHTLESLGDIKYVIMYNPKQWYKKLLRKLGVLDSPFLWLKIKNIL